MRANDDANRRVGWFTAACLLVSNVVGSGIFTTTGFMARDLGDPRLILVLWAAGGLFALAGAISYAELGAALPRVGGEYVYLSRAYGRLWGFLSGWTSFTVGFGAAIAAGAMSFAAYLATLLPQSFPVHDPTVLALALVWGLTAAHGRGVAVGGPTQVLLTLLKVGAIGLLIGGAMAVGGGSWEHLTVVEGQSGSSAGKATIALIFVLYAYSGWNAAAYIAGEIRDPALSLPRVLIAGTLFVTALYLCVNLVYFYALPVPDLAREPVLPVAEKAAAALLGARGTRVVVAVLCLSIAGAISSMVWAGSRVYYAMACDGVLPGFVARTSKAGAPLSAILLQSGWVTILVLSGTFEQLLVYAGVALALFSALAVTALLVLRLREPELPRPYRVPLYPWIPLTFIAASLLIVAYATLERPTESLLSLATIVSGVPLYLFWRRERQP